MVINRKFFIPPPKDQPDFKELIRFVQVSGAGRPADHSGCPDGPWSTETLTDAICRVDPEGQGVDLRTVQNWFQNNDRGASHDSLRWLSQICGCHDPEATRAWHRALIGSNEKLRERRRAIRQEKRHTVPSAQTTEYPVVVPDDSQSAGIRLRPFLLSEATDTIFRETPLDTLPILTFAGAVALGLLSFILGLHDITVGFDTVFYRQIGFLWAPNWTVVFLLILPAYRASLVSMLREWTDNFRPHAYTSQPKGAALSSWRCRLSRASYAYWAVFFLTVIMASVVNWVATHLIPVLENDPGNLTVSWGRITIYRPEVVSAYGSLTFSGLVYFYNAICAYLFFSGFVAIVSVGDDFVSLVNTRDDQPALPALVVDDAAPVLLSNIFKCSALGLLITLMMKLQAAFLGSDSENIVRWLLNDIRSIWASTTNAELLSPEVTKSTPGHYYSFFCVVAICGVYAVVVSKIRSALRKMRYFERAGALKRADWVFSNSVIALLVVAYASIDLFEGFSALVAVTIGVTAYFIVSPKFSKP